MKKYFLLFFAVGLLACSSDDDNGVQDTIEVWNLTERQTQIPVNYNLGDVVWTLNITNQTLQIQNNIQNADFDAGQYDFSMTSNTLTVDFPGDSAVFDLSTSGNTRSLYYDPIPQAIGDEFSLVFSVE